MTEEQTTKAIIKFLKLNNWEVICFDFPQSGTGHSLHINSNLRLGKNKGTIIPDIVAVKDYKVVFFENKDRYVFSDFVKLGDLKKHGNHSESIEKLLKNTNYEKIYYGIGMPHSDKNLNKALESIENIDFLVFVQEDYSISINYQSDAIFY